MVGEEDEGLGEAEAGRQAVLQGEVLLAHRRAARRVLQTEQSFGSGPLGQRLSSFNGAAALIGRASLTSTFFFSSPKYLYCQNLTLF